MTLTISVTHTAKTALLEALEGAPDGDAAHLTITEHYEHGLSLGPVMDGEHSIDVGGLSLFLDPQSATRADRVAIDYVADGDTMGFRIENPNAPPKVVEIGAEQLAAKLTSGDIKVLIDVRTDWERGIASLPDSMLLDEQASHALEALDKDTPIAFYCHHGMRSRMAASQYVQRGYTQVFNLIGGIDAWSMVIDSSIPRY